MRLGGYIVAGLALTVVSTTAIAFQEQGGGAAPVAPAPAEAQQVAPPSEKDLNFSAPKGGVGEGTGTEVRIPGLGKLGVLPKMDFGLELLYGANDSAPQAQEPEQSDEDLRIRGSVKHNF